MNGAKDINRRAPKPRRRFVKRERHVQLTLYKPELFIHYRRLVRFARTDGFLRIIDAARSARRNGNPVVDTSIIASIPAL